MTPDITTPTLSSGQEMFSVPAQSPTIENQPKQQIAIDGQFSQINRLSNLRNRNTEGKQLELLETTIPQISADKIPVESTSTEQNQLMAQKKQNKTPQTVGDNFVKDLKQNKQQQEEKSLQISILLREVNGNNNRLVKRVSSVNTNLTSL